LVKPKPDISLAKKTGHFNLLTTAIFTSAIFGHEQQKKDGGQDDSYFAKSA